MSFCDRNSKIVEWNSEEVVIPYICPIDNKPHRYFIDLYIKTNKGEKYLIEIKPHKQTKRPTGTRKTKRFINEVFTYAKNTAKWEYANKYANDRGMKFQIWTENELRDLGIMIL